MSYFFAFLAVFHIVTASIGLAWFDRLNWPQETDVFLTVLPADWKQFKQKKSDSVLALCIDTQNRSLQTSHSPIIPEQLSVKLMEFNWKYTAAPAKTVIQQLSQQDYSNNIPLIPLKCCENAAYQHEKNHQMSCCDMALFIFTVPVNGPCALYTYTHTQKSLSVNEKHHSECASCTLMHLTGCEWGYRLTGGGL